jgi:hypothetical protein
MSTMQDVARLRATEAGVLDSSGHRLGALYLQGYNVECLLKHLHDVRGKPRPTYGRDGHNLRQLWESAGMRVADTTGHAGEFLALWSTGLRYEFGLPPGADPDTLQSGALDLAARVTARVRTASRRRYRRQP